jgi:hypothetical protein
LFEQRTQLERRPEGTIAHTRRNPVARPVNNPTSNCLPRLSALASWSGNTRIDPRRRRQWLKDIAAKLDPPRAIIAPWQRLRRARQRRREGKAVFRLEG